jgi:hypothetical protein
VLTTGYGDVGQAARDDGLRTSLAATIGGVSDFTNAYFYDSHQQITSIRQSGSTGGDSVAAKRVDFSYNADNQTTAIARFANLAASHAVAKTSFGYDSHVRLTDLIQADTAGGGPDAPLAQYHWTFDAANRVKEFISPGASNIDQQERRSTGRCGRTALLPPISRTDSGPIPDERLRRVRYRRTLC